MTPKVLKGWTVRGDLPKVDFSRATDSDLDLLDEDLLQVIDASRTYTLDVGWYPAASRAGQFVCRLIRSDNWESPLQQLETSNRETVRQWINQTVQEVQALVGQPGQFSDRIGLFIKIKRRAARSAPKPIPTPLTRTPTVSSPVDNRLPSAGTLPQFARISTTTPTRFQPPLQHAA